MLQNTLDIQEQVRDFIKDNFKEKRVLCLIAYGSSLSNSSSEPEDHDFILLLDSFDVKDYEILKQAKQSLPVELFVDYLDQIEAKGLDNYQRGRHGSYFFACLSTAKCLIGENIYAAKVSQISERSIKYGLLYRIEEYFYRIQKGYVNHADGPVLLKESRKYYARICLDLLLYTGEMSFSEVHDFHYLDLIGGKVQKSKTFNAETKKLLRDFFKDDRLDLIPQITNGLYGSYIRCFKDFRDTYENKSIL